MIDFIATVICGLSAYLTSKWLLDHYEFFRNRKILAWMLAAYPMQMLRYFGAKYFNINQVIFGTNAAEDIVIGHNFMLSVISFFVVFFLIYYQIKIMISSRKKNDPDSKNKGHKI